MAVDPDSVTNAFDGSSGGSIDRDGAVEYKALWQLSTTDPADQSQVIIVWWQLNMFGLGSPYIYANDAIGSLATCKNIRPIKKANTTKDWFVEVTYSRESDDAKQTDGGEHTTNPTDYRPVVSASTRATTKVGNQLIFIPGWSDYSDRIKSKIPDGLTMPVNSALDPFEPFPEIDSFTWWISIEINLLEFDGNVTHVNYLNSHPITFNWNGLTLGPVDQWQAKIRDAELQFRRVNTVDHWNVRFYVEVLADEDRFWHVLPDRGWHGIGLDDTDPDGHGGTFGQGVAATPTLPGRSGRVGILDPHGAPVRSLVPLDGDGHPLDISSVPFKPKISRWWEGKQMDFNTHPVISEILFSDT